MKKYKRDGECLGVPARIFWLRHEGSPIPKPCSRCGQNKFQENSSLSGQREPAGGPWTPLQSRAWRESPAMQVLKIRRKQLSLTRGTRKGGSWGSKREAGRMLVTFSFSFFSSCFVPKVDPAMGYVCKYEEAKSPSFPVKPPGEEALGAGTHGGSGRKRSLNMSMKPQAHLCTVRVWTQSNRDKSSRTSLQCECHPDARLDPVWRRHRTDLNGTAKALERRLTLKL